MKVCHCISSIDKNYGGTSIYEQLLLNEMVKYVSLSLVTMKSVNPLPIDKKIELHFANKSFPFLQLYFSELKKIFNSIDCDLYHGNGLWQLPVHKMVKTAIQKNKPYVISPHGMLRPWALEQRRLKKKIALWLYQYKDLSNAACLHSTAKIEADEIRSLGFNNPIAVIPNGIDLSEYSMSREKIQNSKKTILYLSRVFPKKGLEFLIEAWSLLQKSERNDWEIIIAGNGDKNYIAALQKLILNKEMGSEIKFVGPLYEQDKISTYHNADLFVLPTLGENFGIVVAEALACGVPVITTKGAPWEELNTHKAGWWIDIGVEPLAKALTEAMQLSDGERKQMGLNGRKLVEEKYSIESVAQKMILLYEWILYNKEKPRFIY